MSPQGVHTRSQTAFRLPRALLAWLKAQAEREGRTMTDIVENALNDYRAHRERKQEAANRLGI